MLDARWMTLVGLACVLSDWTGIVGHAPAQSAVERVESKLRERMLRPAGAPDSASPSSARSAPESVPPGKVVGPSASTSPRPYLGITVDDVNDRGRGVRVLQVHPGGPGARAEIHSQDLIVSAAGQRVRAVSDMAEILEVQKPGDKLLLDVLRDGESQKIEVILGRQPSSASSPPPPKEPSDPAASKPSLPEFPEIKPPANDRTRIEQLERRIEELERRIEELERRLDRVEKSLPRQPH